MHNPVRHWYGFSLSLTTAVMWGVLPVFLKLSLQAMDSSTITWYRFTFAAVMVFLWLLSKKALPRINMLTRPRIVILLLATLALVINYVANVKALDYINPETASVMMQMAPFMLMLGGIGFYGERFTRLEKFGALVLFSGLVMFFNQRILGLFDSLSNDTLGILLIFVAATTWAGYALVQKILLRALTAKQLTLMIYALGALFLLPFTQLSDLLNMNVLQLSALAFCCVNTIIGYGAFTEALHVWQASKVSAVIALAPLFTFLSMELAVRWMPQYFVASPLDKWAYAGAALVMIGSITAALGRRPMTAAGLPSSEP